MTKDERQEIEEEEVLEQMEDEVEEVQDENGEIIDEELEESQTWIDPEIYKLKDLLSRTQADFDNFKKRTQRDREDMIFFLKSDIYKKILPRVDDLERIIKNTPEDFRNTALYEWIIAMEKNFKKDLENAKIKTFDSIWCEVDPNKHDVMTKIPWKDWIIVDEFEKWYELDDRILRVAKVVVGYEA